MAIDPHAYDLTGGLLDVWTQGPLTEIQRSLISSCLPDGEGEPRSEEHLGTLQVVVAACETLLEVRPTAGEHWLTSIGKAFPNAVHRFAFEVAKKMYMARNTNTSSENFNKLYKLPTKFLDDLSEAIQSSMSHVATLNYDGLLSQDFEKRGLMGSDFSILRDGFIDGIFHRQNLFRPHERGGWYLHLHGCPLFSTNSKGQFRKLSPKSLLIENGSLKYVGQHIVLTHAQHKMSIIQGSHILDTYWEFLNLAINRCSEILIFGYSGNDIHLNRIIAQGRGERSIRVVEWLGAGKRENRIRFWSDQLGGGVDLIQKEDVLTFDDW
jgi:hypothetical protein